MFFRCQEYYCVIAILCTCLTYNHCRSIMQAIITINKRTKQKKTLPENRYPIKVVFKNNIERDLLSSSHV